MPSFLVHHLTIAPREDTGSHPELLKKAWGSKKIPTAQKVEIDLECHIATRFAMTTETE